MTATYLPASFPAWTATAPHGAPATGAALGRAGPELLDRRLAHSTGKQRIVFGANATENLLQMLGPSTEETGMGDPWVTRGSRNSRPRWCRAR